MSILAACEANERVSECVSAEEIAAENWRKKRIFASGKYVRCLSLWQKQIAASVLCSSTIKTTTTTTPTNSVDEAKQIRFDASTLDGRHTDNGQRQRFRHSLHFHSFLFTSKYLSDYSQSLYKEYTAKRGEAEAAQQKHKKQKITHAHTRPILWQQ